MRKLTELEIQKLKNQRCVADCWDTIYVATNGFDTNFVHNVKFSGEVRLGVYDKVINLKNGISYHTGVYNARIHNSTIGDNVLIDGIRTYLANYDVDDNVTIINCDKISVDESTTFGNGIRVSVLNEVGGRDVPIYDGLSVHLAYIIAFYRHKPQAVENIIKQIDAYAESRRSDRGKIETGARLVNCHGIIDTYIGEYANLEGVKLLENGTIKSTKEAPITIGNGVNMKEFIVLSSTTITDDAMIDKCFVGEGCQIGKQYSAENCLFFANCMGMHGEACAIFAGPYTVTHHKATLLIAGYFSFLNAGSGSNQSNHMYKLGPIHQGILERGSKTSSDSYILWPSRVGAFSLVMGRHTQHMDTSDLPFSYLIEKDNRTTIAPGYNLRSVGTIRDAKKWQKRDKRKSDKKIDQINFNLLSPYTIQKMLRGYDLLNTIKRTTGENADYYIYQNGRINASSMIKGVELYRKGIVKFLGNSLITKIQNSNFDSIESLLNAIKPKLNIGLGEWVDMSGMIAPKSIVDTLIGEIEQGSHTLETVQSYIEKIHSNYYDYEWVWAYDLMCKWLNKSSEELTYNDLIELIEDWKKSVVELDKELYSDAKKEFTLITKVGFGIDGGKPEMHADFEQVRGEFESNDFVTEVLSHIERKQKLGEETIALLSSLPR